MEGGGSPALLLKKGLRKGGNFRVKKWTRFGSNEKGKKGKA